MQTSSPQTSKKLINTGDWVQIIALIISSIVFALSTTIGKLTVLPTLSSTLALLFNSNYWIQTYSTFLLGWAVSLGLKVFSERFEFEHWRYVFLLAFSLLGSVLVSALTIDMFSPYLTASALTLSHLSWWSWKKEFRESKEFNDKLAGSVTTLDNKILKAANDLTEIDSTVSTLHEVLNKMPNDSAFRAAARNYGVVSQIVTDFRSAVPVLSSKVNKVKSSADKESVLSEIATHDQEAISTINRVLESFCAIAEAWTHTSASYFEANVMLIEDTSELDTSIEHNQTAFDRGAFFFPANATLENLPTICQRVLSVFTEVGYFDQSRRKKKSLKPLLLPVDLFSKYDSISVPGAPSAYENKNVELINDVATIADSFSSYGDMQKKQIRSYFESQKGCGSVVSLPIPVPAVWKKDGEYLGIVNVYRPELGGVKNEHLFHQLCVPILYLLSDLLVFKLSLSSLRDKLGNTKVEK